MIICAPRSPYGVEVTYEWGMLRVRIWFSCARHCLSLYIHYPVPSQPLTQCAGTTATPTLHKSKLWGSKRLNKLLKAARLAHRPHSPHLWPLCAPAFQEVQVFATYTKPPRVIYLFLWSNLHAQRGARPHQPQDQESHALQTEAARLPKGTPC